MPPWTHVPLSLEVVNANVLVFIYYKAVTYMDLRQSVFLLNNHKQGKTKFFWIGSTISSNQFHLRHKKPFLVPYDWRTVWTSNNMCVSYFDNCGNCEWWRSITQITSAVVIFHGNENSSNAATTPLVHSNLYEYFKILVELIDATVIQNLW